MIFDEIYKNNNLISINEATVARGNKMAIGVDPDYDRNYDNIAYFKVYNNSNPKAASEVIRLHFYDNGYEAHKGKPLFKMKKRDREELMKLLISPPTAAKFEKCSTAWKALIMEFNSVVKPQFILPDDLIMPDYTKIIF